MKLLTSKQAAESPADGRTDGESVARLACEQNVSPDFSWLLIEWPSRAAQHVFAQCVCAYMCEVKYVGFLKHLCNQDYFTVLRVCAVFVSVMVKFI